MVRSGVAAWIARRGLRGRREAAVRGLGRWPMCHVPADDGERHDAHHDDRHGGGRSAWRGFAPCAPRGRDADPDQDEDHRVRERVVVVVGQARDDDRETRCGHRQEAGAPEEAKPEPADGRPLGGIRARHRQATIPTTTARAATAAPSETVIRPVSGQDTTRIATTRRRVTSGQVRGLAAGLHVDQGGAHLGEVGGQFVDDQRHVDERDDRESGQPGPQDRAALVAGRRDDGRRRRTAPRRPAAA